MLRAVETLNQAVLLRIRSGLSAQAPGDERGQKPHVLSVLVLAAALHACGGHLTAERLQASRLELLQAAFAANAFNPDRRVTHASHVCSLRVDGQWFGVLDVQELVHGAAVPRGANAIIVLDPEFKLANRLSYASERPLFCVGNRLYVWGDLQSEDAVFQGNELTFTEHARRITARHVEANDVPAPAGKYPPTQ